MAQDLHSSPCTSSKKQDAEIFFPKILGLLAALAIGGCASQAKPPVDMTLVQQIQHGIVATCGYKVELGNLAAIINTFVPGATLVGTAIGAVCAAVEPLTVAHAGPAVNLPPPIVNGVPVKGHKVPLPKPRPK